MEPMTIAQWNRLKQKGKKHYNKVKRLRKLQKLSRKINRRK